MAEARRGLLGGKWHEKNRPVYLMATLFVLVLIHPEFESGAFATLVLSVFFFLVLVSAALAVLRRRWQVVVVCCMGVPWVLLSWLRNLVDLGAAMEMVAVGLQIGFFLLLAAMGIAGILSASRVTTSTLCNAVSVYLLMGIAWASMYQMLVLLDPAAIGPASSGTAFAEHLYFSFTTLTTLGYGDVTPVSHYARSLVMVESVIGPMYLAILIARLVSLHERTSSKEAA